MNYSGAVIFKNHSGHALKCILKTPFARLYTRKMIGKCVLFL
jgi:hypothetical protein